MSKEAPFYAAVYAMVSRIPAGHVATYGDVAMFCGALGAAQAVGNALRSLGSSQFAEVPWWRVINSYGAISLKGRGGAADLQRALLEGEGIAFDTNGRVDLARWRWWPDGRG